MPMRSLDALRVKNIGFLQRVEPRLRRINLRALLGEPLIYRSDRPERAPEYRQASRRKAPRAHPVVQRPVRHAQHVQQRLLMDVALVTLHFHVLARRTDGSSQIAPSTRS